MPNDDVHLIRSGPHLGCLLRLAEDGTVELRGQRSDAPWLPAPLRTLAREYEVGEGPWVWLRARGIRRPSPSGSRSASQPAAERSTRAVRVSLEAYERLRQTAEAVGVPLSLAATTAVLAGCEVMRKGGARRRNGTQG